MICPRQMSFLPMLGRPDGIQYKKERQSGYGMTAIQSPVGGPVYGNPTKATQGSEDSKRGQGVALIRGRCFSDRWIEGFESIFSIDALRMSPRRSLLIRNLPALRVCNAEQRPI